MDLGEARPDVEWSLHAVSGDVDCDGDIDHARLGHSKGQVHVGIIASSAESPQVLDFTVSTMRQAAVCSDDAELDVESLDYDPEESVGELEGFVRSTKCIGLVLAGGGCDSIHMYWNTITAEVNWWRH